MDDVHLVVVSGPRALGGDAGFPGVVLIFLRRLDSTMRSWLVVLLVAVACLSSAALAAKDPKDCEGAWVV